MSVELLAFGACGAVVLFVALWRALGIELALLSALLTSITLFPALLTPDSAMHHVGIAGPTMELRTFGVVLVGAAAVILWHRKYPVALAFLPLLCWLAAGAIIAWPEDQLRGSGHLQFIWGALAWGAGSWLGARSRHVRHWDRTLGVLLLIIVGAHALVATLQWLGVPINPMPAADAEILGTRVNGLSNHPNNLGKILLFCVALAIPLWQSRDHVAKWAGFLASGLALGPFLLAQGRANLVSVAALLCIAAWYYTKSRRRFVHRGVILGLAVFGAVAATLVLARFVEDPGGGVRGSLTQHALGQIAARPLFGTGPNGYVVEASPTTGSFIPVHNAFLLLVAELGIPGAAAFLLPVALAVAAGWLRRNDAGASGGSAQASIGLVVPLFVIGLTGWGLLGSSILPLWLFCTSLLVCATDSREGLLDRAIRVLPAHSPEIRDSTRRSRSKESRTS